jgi:hypothetical protein
MRAAGRITLSLVVAALGAAIACSDAAKPLGSGDTLTNDTAGEDAYSPPIPQPPSDGGEGGATDSGYAPALGTCSSCSCDPTKNYCFSGGTPLMATRVFPLSGPGFGEPTPDAGPPPPPCTLLPAGSVANGCTPLPAACAAAPSCTCLLGALQPLYSCYLVCTPTPGYLEVYCPDGPSGPSYPADASDAPVSTDASDSGG